MVEKDDMSSVWGAYIDNLEYVLEDVDMLLENIDAENVAISSDHGNSKGEWWIYEHPPGIAIDSLRRVPWYTTTAEDNQTHTPSINKDHSNIQIDDRLEALGYK
jgi:hypothetical protein